MAELVDGYTGAVDGAGLDKGRARAEAESSTAHGKCKVPNDQRCAHRVDGVAGVPKRDIRPDFSIGRQQGPHC